WGVVCCYTLPGGGAGVGAAPARGGRGARGGGVPPAPTPPQPLAHISRQWFRVRDTYAVNVVREDADAALLIGVAVCVIRMAEREREG
ncbi:hypothetical protein ACFVZW_11905, partial [Streptomyces sp. NPDC059567]